tara:strand:- start:10401 stop:11078 length:678 start_codon:yes stop_codon:yes gene_type:complete
MSSNLLIKSEKIRELKEDEPIRAVLRYVITLLGVNVDKHDKLVFDVIISTIQRSFKSLEVEEIKEAFNLAINGDLDLKPDEIQHYQKFSSLYVSTILKSYKRYKVKHNKIKPIETKQVPALTFDEIKAHSEHMERLFLSGRKIDTLGKWTELFQHYVKNDKISIVKLESENFAEKVKTDLTKERLILREAGLSTIVHDMNIESDMFFRCEVFKRAVINYYKLLKK